MLAELVFVQSLHILKEFLAEGFPFSFLVLVRICFCWGRLIQIARDHLIFVQQDAHLFPLQPHTMAHLKWWRQAPRVLCLYMGGRRERVTLDSLKLANSVPARPRSPVRAKASKAPNVSSHVVCPVSQSAVDCVSPVCRQPAGG